jgi:transposase
MEETKPVRKKYTRNRSSGNPVGRPPGAKTGHNALKIIDLHLKGVSQDDIARAVGITQQTVQAHLAKWLSRIPELADSALYRENRANLLSGAHAQVLKSVLEPAKLDQARVGELAKLLHTVHQQERLERGLSTSNRAEIRYTKIEIPPD